MNPWQPRIAEGAAPLYERLVDALEGDVRSGRLKTGDRLPPHRDLAHGLSIGIGTVSRAYAEAERRGLISSHVGRGSFVAGMATAVETGGGLANAGSGMIDMAHNLPPAAPAARWLGETLNRLRRRGDLLETIGYGPPEGMEAIRRAGAQWLSRRHHVVRATAGGLIQCNGGQQGLALSFSTMLSAGDSLLCEAATYPGIRTIADHAGYRLTGVAMDQGGLCPDALDRAAAETGARMIVLMPTLQNPTTITMDAARRADILAVARARDLMIVEDDAYRVLGDADCPTGFADLAPERTFLVAGLSKSVAPGLRLGFILPPEGSNYRDRLISGIRALGYCPPALGGLVFSQWVEDGVADRIADDILTEAGERTALAVGLLGDAAAKPGAAQSLHLWLPMPLLEAEQVAGRALRAGIDLTPPAAPLLLPSSISGLRLCLGAVADRDVLRNALLAISSTLGGAVDHEARDIV